MPLVASPTIGFVVAFFTMVGLVWIARGHWQRPVLVALWVIGVGAAGLGAVERRRRSALALAKSTLETRIVMGLGVLFLIAVPVLYGARPNMVHAHSRRLQLLSAAMMAFGHGSNDAQKSMGIITLALVAFVTTGHATAGVDAVVGDAGRRKIRADLGDRLVRGGDRRGHCRRRHAHHQDDGHEDHPHHAHSGLRG